MNDRTEIIMLGACLVVAAGCLGGLSISREKPETSAPPKVDAQLRHVVEETSPARGARHSVRGEMDALSEGGSASASSDMAGIPSSFESIYEAELRYVEPMYVPSRESLQYHIDHHIGQIADLSLADVRELFFAYGEEWWEESWADYYLPCTGMSTVSDRFGIPTPEDVDRLWNSPGFQGKFGRYLELEHRAFVQHELRWALDQYELGYLSDQTGAQAGALWNELWETPDIYPHWAFLMEVAQRHFR